MFRTAELGRRSPNTFTPIEVSEFGAELFDEFDRIGGFCRMGTVKATMPGDTPDKHVQFIRFQSKLRHPRT